MCVRQKEITLLVYSRWNTNFGICTSLEVYVNVPRRRYILIHLLGGTSSHFFEMSVKTKKNSQIRFRMISTCVRRKKTTFMIYLPTNHRFLKSEHYIIPLPGGIYFTQKNPGQIIFLKILGWSKKIIKISFFSLYMLH